MNSQISRLRITEAVFLREIPDLQPTIHTHAEGDEDAVERTVIEVAERMGAAEQALRLMDIDNLARAAADLGRIGGRIGFVELARVANDAEGCIRQRDYVAVHAVIERMIRIGDASLAALIEGVTVPL